MIPQHLKTESKLLIHRTRPVENINQIVLWKFIGKDTIEKNLKNYYNARRINILHGYYSPHVFI